MIFMVSLSRSFSSVIELSLQAAGGWDSKTGHNAPLYANEQETVADVAPSFIKSKYNCHAAVQGYIAAGAPRSKLVMGLGLYGRGWQGVSSEALNGFSQAALANSPMGTWENGVFDYDHLKKSYLPSYTRYWDDASKVPFLFNLTTGIWITYDDAQSIQLKSDYIKREELAGAMFWELSGDREHELIDVAFKTLLDNDAPPSVTKTPSPANSTSTPKPSPWELKKNYRLGDQVIYEKKIYQCLLAHQSESGWIPSVIPALWKAIK